MPETLRQLLERNATETFVRFADIIAIPLQGGGYRCYVDSNGDLQYIGKLLVVRGKLCRLPGDFNKIV